VGVHLVEGVGIGDEHTVVVGVAHPVVHLAKQVGVGGVGRAGRKLNLVGVVDVVAQYKVHEYAGVEAFSGPDKAVPAQPDWILGISDSPPRSVILLRLNEALAVADQ
nr:hypothetical protein [Tanacetum cinerariifolium]